MLVEYILIAICTFFASLMSFYSGFGLGTILMPVIAIFLPLPIAIGLTAIVHLAHNLLKSGLLWKAIDWSVALRFGGTALISSIPGALLLKGLSTFVPIKEYVILSVHAKISILHISIGLLLILFATMEMFPNRILKIKNLFIGGVISGFFGGLSGNQGAFRSVFLVNTSLNKETFIGTNAVIATAVDTTRLVTYGLVFRHQLIRIDVSLLIIALASAFVGICLGMVLLRKVTISFIQKVIVSLLYVLGVLLVVGII
jgi:uncharacterized membrane protein YfcA